MAFKKKAKKKSRKPFEAAVVEKCVRDADMTGRLHLDMTLREAFDVVRQLRVYAWSAVFGGVEMVVFSGPGAKSMRAAALEAAFHGKPT